MGKRKGEAIHGWVNLDKPYGMTSTQAIGKVRRLLNAQKIGHAGTLDPLATGVLPIALGEATKTIPFAQDAAKRYSFTVTWGETRDTDDSEGQVIATSDHRPLEADILAILSRFTGEITQIPPLFSAIKVNGARAYDLARAGEIPDLKSRVVFVGSLTTSPPTFTLPPAGGGMGRVDADLSASYPKLGGGVNNPNEPMNETSFEVVCGKGTYIRSLARDMAEMLGTKGYISSLRREKVGCFSLENAISLDKLEGLDYGAARNAALLPLQTVLDDIPALALKAEETAKLRSGQVLHFVSKPDFDRLTKIGLGLSHTMSALAVFNGNPVALIEQEKAEIRPVRVFNL